MAKFSDPGKIRQVVEAMRLADLPRAVNRTRINTLFNGEQPFTAQEAADNRIQTNVNFLEATRLARDSRLVFENAFINVGDQLNITVDFGAPDKALEYSSKVTKAVNKLLKTSRKYLGTQKSKFAQVVLHGNGPVSWARKNEWCPFMIGIEDLFIPSGTYRDLSNLDHFSIYRRFTIAELYKAIEGPNVAKGWNKPVIKQLIAQKNQQLTQPSNWDNWWFPEKVAEDYKANAGYYASDAQPTVAVWDFYFNSEEEGGEGWRRKIIPAGGDNGYPSDVDPILFDGGETSYGDSLDNLLCIQFGDGNNVAPFRYHSVRGLGFLLYAVCHLSNRLNCRLADTAFREMIYLFRNVPDGDRERLLQIDMYDLGVIPDGLTMVTSNERHQVNEGLVGSVMSKMRQFMAENSSSFTRDSYDGTQKEMTATESLARSQDANTLASSMLGDAYINEGFQDREICRRLTINGSTHPEVKEFQQGLLEEGVPIEAIDSERWEIVRNRNIGNGNKSVQMAMADRLMAIRGNISPEGQTIVDRLYVQATTDNPDLANQLVPPVPPIATATTEKAQLAWGSLIAGQPVNLGSGVNYVEYVETLLQNLGNEFKIIQATGQQPGMREVIGLSNVVTHIGQQVQKLSQDQSNGQKVKMYSDALGQAANQIKAFGQQLQEQQQAQGGQQNPEAQAKIQAIIIEAQAQSKIAEQMAQQKLAHKELQFNADQARRDKKLKAELAAQDARTSGDIIRQNARTALTAQQPQAPASNE